jgi:hypothetical protein
MSNMETIWHIDKDITVGARKLLGESVEYAYTLFNMDSASDKPKSDSYFDERDGSIRLDIDNVIIKMKNVKPVMLSVSEWGDLRPLWDDETVEGLDLVIV